MIHLFPIPFHTMCFFSTLPLVMEEVVRLLPRQAPVYRTSVPLRSLSVMAAKDNAISSRPCPASGWSPWRSHNSSRGQPCKPSKRATCYLISHGAKFVLRIHRKPPIATNRRQWFSNSFTITCVVYPDLFDVIYYPLSMFHDPH